jgi:hypothetical protein
MEPTSAAFDDPPGRRKRANRGEREYEMSFDEDDE